MSETIRSALARATVTLREAGIPDPGRDARALVADATGLAPDRLRLEDGQALDPAQTQRLDAAVAARLSRQPVAQIIGARQFWGRTFRVTPDVLDPRPETELIVARALDGPAPRRVLDLGTGSGILAISILAEVAGATGLATDVSRAALDVATDNAVRHGVDTRLSFAEGSWFSPVAGSFDLIVSNPPYIPAEDIAGLEPDVRDWEPRFALTPGGDGLDAYRAIAADLAAHLAPGGRALLEFGVGQADDVSAIFAASGAHSIRIHEDLSGKSRVIEVISLQSEAESA